ncbi:MAG: TlpA disulfide reductase family protein [Flavobacteriales bacterium]|nr:TlpA disulfide reductase family protein [Flavobacteriales bacterium]
MFRSFLVIATSFLTVLVQGQELVFSGKISGMADENLTVEYPTDWFGETWKEEILVLDNSFHKKIELPASGWLKLSYKDKDRKVFAWKEADSLHLSFEADFLDDELDVADKAGRVHAFQEHVLEKFGSRLSVVWLEEQAKNATNIDAVEMDAFSLRNDVIHALESFEQVLPDEFVSGYKNHLGYYYYLSLLKFSSVKTSHSSIPKATEIPKVLLDGLSWERMNRASELESTFFRELLLEYMDYKALEEYDFMKFSDRNAAVQEGFNIAREHLEEESLRYYLTATLLRNASDVRPSLLRQMLVHLKLQENSDVFVSLVEKRISDQINAQEDEVPVKMEEDQISSEYHVELQDLKGKSFSLSDLKGKVLYVDIWASWCGPCRKQFPFAKELKNKLSKKEKKNIEFLYISIDNTETVWKMAIEELGIDGLHGISKGGWGSEVTAKFGVKSIPRYFIFDKKGRVVDKNAPRPSDPQLLDVLRKLVGK